MNGWMDSFWVYKKKDILLFNNEAGLMERCVCVCVYTCFISLNMSTFYFIKYKNILLSLSTKTRTCEASSIVYSTLLIFPYS